MHSFSHAEQQYLMYLHYCKGRFRVGVGVYINKNTSKRYLLLVSGSCIPSIHNSVNFGRHFLFSFNLETKMLNILSHILVI